MRIAPACLLAATLVLTSCGREGVALPDSVEVTCHEDGTTTLSTRSVRTQPDGVHVRVVNRTGEDVSLVGLLGGARPGTSDFVGVRQRPGPTEVACSANDGPLAGRVLTLHPLVIRDVAQHWIDPEPNCLPGQRLASSTIHYAAPDRESPPEPRSKALVIAREGARLRPDDIVEFVGYPQAEPPTVRFVREGKTTRVLLFTRISGHLAVGHEMRCKG